MASRNPVGSDKPSLPIFSHRRIPSLSFRNAPIHPSLKQGVLIAARARWNGQYFAHFDRKAVRVMLVGTNSALLEITGSFRVTLSCSLSPDSVWSPVTSRDT